MNQTKRLILSAILFGVLICILFSYKAQAADLPKEDIELLAQVAHAEAGNQDKTGKRLVVATVLNRVDSDIFPETIIDVLAQEKQFSTYPELKDVKPTDDDYIAVYEELDSRINSEVMFFRTGNYGQGEPVIHWRDHYFTKLGGEEVKSKK